MNCSPSLCRADIEPFFTRDRGIAAWGVAQANEVDSEAVENYRRWIAAGHHGSMDYLARYDDVRCDPRLLLEGAKSLVVCAFPYYPHSDRSPGLPHIARYALGRDYHETVRRELLDAAAEMRSAFGGEYRACVDTAPLRERYWAVRAGLGFIGQNSQLIVPGVGSYVFIGTLLTTLSIDADTPASGDCGRCGKCAAACPGHAIGPDGAFDARKCLSYLTIEYRGEFPESLSLGRCLYGCDRCQEVCPHNASPLRSLLPDFEPSDEMLALSEDDIARMDAPEFNRLFRHSAIRRTKLAGLQRNLKKIQGH